MIYSWIYGIEIHLIENSMTNEKSAPESEKFKYI